jgi:tetratricopeptide (TPR) repeat protein
MIFSTAVLHHRTQSIHQAFLVAAGVFLLGAGAAWLQGYSDARQDRSVQQIDDLAQLPKGEYLRPALVGYQHLGADILWLKLLQVVGNKRNSADEYEWIYHALDVITTLDPQYAYAYYVGGNILGDLAQRPDLSNQLLEKGAEGNPEVWYIPFLLGYNYYFLLGDPAKGAEYIMKAAILPERPAYLPGLATRMAAEAGSAETALAFLHTRVRETQDPNLRQVLVNRAKEVIIERDIHLLERAVEMYRTKHQASPTTLTALVEDRIMPDLPIEPFGGEYRIDVRTGSVSSSTHPERLRTFFKRKTPPMYRFPKTAPSYSFPRTWE